MAEQKKLLVLAGAAAHSYLVETARQMGLHTIVTDYLPPERSPAKQLADEHWELDIKDVGGIAERCRAERVDAVIAACIDPAQRPYQAVCERLGLPCYGTKEQFYTMTNKKAFKQLCRECGVDVIPDYTLEECRGGKAEYPVYVKPADSRGGRGQTVCRSLAEVERAVETAVAESGSGDYLIERYLDGRPMVSVKYWVCDGAPYLSRIHDTYRCSLGAAAHREGVLSIASSRYTRMFRENVDGRIRGLLRRLGLRNGPAGMQGFVDGDTVRFFDASLRAGGSQDGKLLAAASGVNFMRAAIEIALGRKPGVTGDVLRDMLGDRCYPFSGKRMLCLRYPVRPGTVAAVEGLEEIRGREGVVDMRQTIFPGDVIRATGDVRQIAYYVGALVDDSPRAILDMVDFIYSTLRYRDENGEIMGIIPSGLDAAAKLYE